MAQFANKLISPKKVGNSGDVSGKYSPSANSSLDYANLNTYGGPRTYFRRFRNVTGGSSPSATLSFSGATYDIVPYTTSLSTTNIHVSIKVPGKTAFVDIATDFAGANFESGDTDFRGALAGTLSDTSVPITFGGKTVDDDEYIIIRIEADKSWTGYLDSVSISFN